MKQWRRERGTIKKVRPNGISEIIGIPVVGIIL